MLYLRFRWVALQLDAICDPEFVYIADDVKHKLQKLPGTLQQPYAGIFEMISKYPPDSREVTERALRWSMCAQQLLSALEFLAAISMNSDGRYVRRTKHEILRMCRSLLVVDGNLDTFRLSHLSVKEYIEESKPHEYGEIQLHTTAAETCLLFLDYGNKSLRNDPKVAGFYRYAVIYWPNHCYMAAQCSNNGRLRGLFRSFALVPGVSTSFKEWLSTVQLLRSDWFFEPSQRWQWAKLVDSLCNPPSVFFTGCAFDLQEATEVMSIGEPSIIKGRTGLHIAYRYGNYQVAQQLLQRGVDLEAEDDEGKVALFVAVQNGNIDIIRILVSSIWKFKITAKLASAVAKNKRNRNEVMTVLLEQASDIETTEVD